MRSCKKWIARALVGFVLLLGGVGCGGGPEPVNMFLDFQTGSQLNPDENGKSLSVRVRVYSLKEKERFEGARFEELWENDRKALEGDFVERKNEYILQPHSVIRKPLTVEESRQERFIGLVANFRKEDNGYWRAVVPAEAIEDPWFGPPLLRVVMDQYRLKISDKD